MAHFLLPSLVLVLSLAVADSSPATDLAGTWHAALVPTPGRDVAFVVKLAGPDRKPTASLVNGAIEAPFTSASYREGTLTLEMAHFEARIVAHATAAGLQGTYSRTTASGTLELTFLAARRPPASPAPRGSAPLDGEWGIDLGTGEQASRVLGVFRQKGTRAEGTVLSASGDYGPLHGTWDGRDLVLAVFDGFFVYRLDGRLQGDGTLQGEFRSRAGTPVPWRGKRLTAAEARSYLPDGFSLVRAKDPSSPFRFSLPDLQGTVVTSEDPRFLGKPMIVTFSGTWCPNCNDEAPVLAALYRKYHAKGLEVVALHYEYTADAARSRRLMRSFAERYDVPYTLLLAGTTKEAKASPARTQLEGEGGYPTTLYLDATHRVVKTHVGFDGPATGERFAKLKKEMEETVGALVAPGHSSSRR